MTRCNDGLGKDGSKVPSECGKDSSISNWLSHCVSKMQIEWTANAYTSTDVSGKHLVCLNACKCSALKSKAWSIDPILYAAPPCFLMCEHSHRGEKHKSVSKYANWIDCQHLCAQHGQQRDLPCIEVGTCKLHVSFICRLTSLGFYWRGPFNIILRPPIQRDATDRWVTPAAADSHSIWKLNAASEFQVTTVELHLIITVHGSPRELSLVLWALNGRVRAHIWANYPKSSRAARFHPSTHRIQSWDPSRPSPSLPHLVFISEYHLASLHRRKASNSNSFLNCKICCC